MKGYFVRRFLQYNLLLSAISVLVVSLFLFPTVAGLLQAFAWNLATAGFALSAAVYHRQHRREFLLLFNFGVSRREFYALAWLGSGLVALVLAGLSGLVSR